MLRPCTPQCTVLTTTFVGSKHTLCILIQHNKVISQTKKFSKRADYCVASGCGLLLGATNKLRRRGPPVLGEATSGRCRGDGGQSHQHSGVPRVPERRYHLSSPLCCEQYVQQVPVMRRKTTWPTLTTMALTLTVGRELTSIIAHLIPTNSRARLPRYPERLQQLYHDHLRERGCTMTNG